MGFVKVIVIAMGVLILVGFVVVATTLIARMQEPEVPEGGYRTTVGLPAGAEVTDTAISDRQVLLRLETPEGSWLIVIDARTGQERGRVRLVPEAP